MNKKQLFKSFFNLGLIQLFPTFLAIASLIGFVTLIIILTTQPIFGPVDPNETYVPPNSDLWALTIFCAISLLLLSGLIAFILSSTYFISAKKTNDYEKLVTGTKHMSWGWLILSLFIAIMFSLFVFKIITDIGYQYY